MILRTSQSKIMKAFWRRNGLCHITGRNLTHSTNPIKKEIISILLFLFYVMIGGNPFFVVLTGSSPIIEHKPSQGITSLDGAALEALIARGLVRPGIGNPTVIHSINGLFDHPVIYFVQVDQAELASKGHTLLGSKVFSLVDSTTGKTQGGKDPSIRGFGAVQYAKMLDVLLPKLPPPSLAGFARGGGGAVARGGGGAVAGGGGGAVAGGGGRAVAGGGAVASPHHGSGKKSHPAPTCGHSLCTDLHNSDAGHGGIILPVFEYRCHDGSKKSVVIMVYEKGSWNLICEKMEDKDRGCWILTIARALKEEGKIYLSRDLEEYDISLGKSIDRTPVFYVKLYPPTMVKHNLSRGVLNAQVAADNGNPSLPSCYKETKAIGFFERDRDCLVPLPGNPSYPNILSGVVQSWLLRKH